MNFFDLLTDEITSHVDLKALSKEAIETAVLILFLLGLLAASSGGQEREYA